MEEQSEATVTDIATKRTTIDITPKWQDIVNVARNFADGNPALLGVLRELNRLAVIADDEDPNVVLAPRA